MFYTLNKKTTTLIYMTTTQYQSEISNIFPNSIILVTLVTNSSVHFTKTFIDNGKVINQKMTIDLTEKTKKIIKKSYNTFGY